MPHRLIDPSQSCECDSQVEMGLPVIRPQAYGGAELWDGVRQPVRLGEGHPEIKMPIGIFGLQLEPLGELSDCFSVTPERGQRGS